MFAQEVQERVRGKYLFIRIFGFFTKFGLVPDSGWTPKREKDNKLQKIFQIKSDIFVIYTYIKY